MIHNPDSDKWFIVYHRRPLDQTDRNARVVCIDLMEFDKEGQIKPVIMTNTGVAAESITKNTK